MFVTNCLYCGKPFIKNSRRSVCIDCIKRENELLPIVRRYVMNNLRCKLEEVAENTGVEIKYINRFIREARLDISINCKKCGIKMKSTYGDNLCSLCKKLVLQNLMTSAEKINMEKKFAKKK